MSLYVLWRQKMATRIKVVLMLAVVLPVGFALAPARVIDRYATLVSGFFAPPDPISNPTDDDGRKVDEEAVGSALASATSRMDLLKRSIVVTLENPILGVGPGMFVVAENEIAIDEGRRRGYWKASHNMYTQISAEMGLPAVGLFVYLIVLVWKTLSRAEKADPRLLSFAPELRKLAVQLKTSTLVFMLCGVTLSVGYGVFLPMLCAWAIAIERLVSAAQRQALHQAEAETEEDLEEAPAKQLHPVFSRATLPAPSR
jgi:O-antigen ligase